MSSNTQLSGSFSATKPTSSNTSATTIPTQAAGLPSSGNEPQRRSGGGTAASAASRSNLAAPRSGQAGRKSHRNHRKPNTPRFGEADIDDQVSMALPSSRKGTSITHLMSWNVSTSHSHSHHSHGDSYRRHYTRRNPTWGLGSGYHAVDKARYVNANYRFIVHPRGDFRAQTINPDDPLPWDQVLQVLASAQTQQPTCPICLSTPVAPRMAKCGHIFCLPCLLRYMASIDDEKRVPEKKPKYKKCVICMDSIYLSDMRPVRFFVGQENKAPHEGEDVVLRLVMKRQGSILALPRDGADSPVKVGEIPWHFAAEVMDYARVMKGTERYMTEQFSGEVGALEQMEREDEVMFGEDGEWTRKAISAISLQIEGLRGMGNPQGYPMETPKEKEKEKEKKPEIQFIEVEDIPLMYHVTHGARSGHSSSSASRSESETPSPQKPESPVGQLQTNVSELSITTEGQLRYGLETTPRDSPYYFYQALPHYYLSSLDIRILKTAFGSYINFPSTILPRVENVTTGHSVDDDFRKRTKYLSHLPNGCEIGLVECDWTDVVSADILEQFRTEIERRRKRKRDKDSREERDRIRAERQEDEARWAAARQRRRESSKEEDDPVAPTTAQSEPNGSESSSTRIGALPWSTPPSIAQGTSFATLASPSTSPAQGRTVWGTPAVPSSGETEPAVPVPKRSDDNGGWLPDWERDILLEDDLLAQLEARGGTPSGSGWTHSQGNSGQSGRKKKFKKVTLMTNGGKRGA